MGSISTTPDYSLTAAQKAHFLEHGFVKIPQCFTRAQSDEFQNNIWKRLGMDPNDKSTWTTEKTNMPWHRLVPVSEFAPKAWAGMCELLGGEERISDEMQYRSWSDGFIVNLGREGYSEEQELDLRGKLGRRHLIMLNTDVIQLWTTGTTMETSSSTS